MPAKSITNKDKIGFVRDILLAKIRSLHLHTTPACLVLGKQIGLSNATLLKVLKDEVTHRTVNKMIQAGWLTLSDLNAVTTPKSSTSSGNTTTPNTPPRTQTQNDQSQQKVREDAAFQRGFACGKTEGFAQGQRVGSPSNFNNTVAYNRGYADGLRTGQLQRQQPTNTNTGLPMDRLQRLFNMTVAKGAAQGEVVAARNAAGKALARWIKDKFGQDVTVQVQ